MQAHVQQRILPVHLAKLLAEKAQVYDHIAIMPLSCKVLPIDQAHVQVTGEWRVSSKVSQTSATIQ